MQRDEIIRKAASGESMAYADLYGADLRGANLYGANLRGAVLTEANLTEANLIEANLIEANLYRANLRGAVLLWANLRGANLYGANLRGANLYEAVLTEANLYGANLYGANLYGANLGDENSATRRYIESTTLVPPETGAFDAWKSLDGGHIALLRVPSSAIRYSATSRKCRVSEAQVLKIFDRHGREVAGPIASRHDPALTYSIGSTVTPSERFDTDRWNECSSGIHCFLTRYEAETY